MGIIKMKVTLAELKKIVRESKSSHPKLSASKVELHKFATEHNLLHEKEKKAEEMVVVHTKLAEKSKPPAEKMRHLKEAEKEVKVAEKAVGGLGAFQKHISDLKAKGMSHKDAMAHYKQSKEVKKKSAQ